MNINFEYHDVAGSQRLEAFATEKLNKLESKYDFIISADVYFKTENTSNPENGKIVTVRLSVPGSAIFAETNGPSLEASMAKVMEEVKVQLQKRKEKIKTH